MENTPNRNDDEKASATSEHTVDNETFEPHGDEEWDFHEEDEEDDDSPLPPRPKWIKNTIIFLLVAALVGNVLAFWPQIYNMKTLPFLFKSKELSTLTEIQHYKEAVVLVSTDKGKGTGFHINDGYIVTNDHVIEDAAYTLIKFPEHEHVYRAELAASDSDLDIAILKIDAEDRQLPFIEIERNKSQWEPGDHIYVIGNPLYFTGIANEGSILDMTPIQGRRNPAMALDAPVFSGNSGSPVINEEGKAIAVVYATTKLPHGDEIIEAGLAVPVDDFDSLLSELLPAKPVN